VRLSRYARGMGTGLAALALLAGLASGCGSGEDSPAAGSPEKPLVAKLPEQAPVDGRSNEGTSGSKQAPGYKELLERQSSHPQSEFTPCNLVSPDAAAGYLGAPVAPPVEAPQGPTCIYRTRDGKQFVTVAVQPLDLAAVRSQIRGTRQVDVAGRAGLCGRHGQPMLYVPLSGGRVLGVSGDCDVALRFASTAVDALSG
jgi:Protein of unknown function (DUF3558)